MASYWELVQDNFNQQAASKWTAVQDYGSAPEFFFSDGNLRIRTQGTFNSSSDTAGYLAIEAPTGSGWRATVELIDFLEETSHQVFFGARENLEPDCSYAQIKQDSNTTTLEFLSRNTGTGSFDSSPSGVSWSSGNLIDIEYLGSGFNFYCNDTLIGYTGVDWTPGYLTLTCANSLGGYATYDNYAVYRGSGEKAEFDLGPEPYPISPGCVVLDQEAHTISWSGWNWDSGNNGTVTEVYDVRYDGNVIASNLIGNSYELDPTGYGLYDVVAKASNDGGNSPINNTPTFNAVSYQDRQDIEIVQTINKFSHGFKGISHYGDPTLITELEHNIKHWLDWSFLEIGAWREVDSTTSGIYGGSFAQLYPLEGSLENTYFGIRKDWVYENDVTYNSLELFIDNIAGNTEHNKLQITLRDYEEGYFRAGDIVDISGNQVLNGKVQIYSGIDSRTFLIDSVFLATESGTTITVESGTGLSPELSADGTVSGELGSLFGTYSPAETNVYIDGVQQTSGYSINYPLGYVAFDNAVSGTVTADYAYRNVQTYVAAEKPHQIEIQKGSLNPSDINWSYQINSGEFSSDPSQRMQLPAVVVEAIPNKRSVGYELGSPTLKMDQTVRLKVISETKYDRDIITDILSEQKHKTLNLYDIDVVNRLNQMPLDYNGDINSNGVNYTGLVSRSNLFWAQAWIKDAVVNEIETNSPDLYMSSVQYRVEVVK